MTVHKLEVVTPEVKLCKQVRALIKDLIVFNIALGDSRALEGARRLVDGSEPPVPLEQGNRTILDKLRQRYPELRGDVEDYELAAPASVDDLAIISLRIKLEGQWRDYRLEIVA